MFLNINGRRDDASSSLVGPRREHVHRRFSPVFPGVRSVPVAPPALFRVCIIVTGLPEIISRLNSSTMNNLARLERAERLLATRLWGGARNVGQPMWMHHLQEHTSLVRNKIPAAKRRAAAKRGWNAVRKHVKARGIVSFLYRRTMRPPSSPGGRGFQRLARQTNVGGKSARRSVGTSTSPRRSPKRRNTGTSP